MEHEFKVDSPIVIERILSRNLGKCSEQLRNEIHLDTTPVPFFGDFENATIVSVGINPSSREFQKYKRLCHLSDLGLPTDYYRYAKFHMTDSQAIVIGRSLLNYFENKVGNKLTYLDEWFNPAEIAINGCGASYFQEKLNANNAKIACHVDLFPWSTKAFSGLEPGLQKEFKTENFEFFTKFIEQEKIMKIVLFGNEVRQGLEDAFESTGYQIRYENIESEDGPYGSTFETGNVWFKSQFKKFFYTTSGPSRPFMKKLDKFALHAAFSKFIEKNR